MREQIQKNRATLKELYDGVMATGSQGMSWPLETAIEKAIHLVLEQTREKGKVIFIGNGGSAAIASHMATDFCKNLGMRAMAFNDSSLLTCLGNDFGYAHVFEKAIEMYAESGDVLIAISSSGKSENILRGAAAARQRHLKIITLTGFEKDNPLRQEGDINFYVPAAHYGHVEVIHHALCHCLVDVLLSQKAKPGMNTPAVGSSCSHAN